MFRISRRLDYGIQLMVALAKEEGNLPQPTAKLAKNLEIPLPFLHQIGHTLMQSGLINASPGPKGGLKLNVPSNDVSVLNIAEALEGPICLNNCLSSGDECSRQDQCSAQTMWSSIQNQIITQLGNTTLNDLASQEMNSVANAGNKTIPVPAD
jgi:Rrf2 family protein